MVGRPQTGVFEELGFDAGKINRRYTATCRNCKRILQNTAVARLLSHRNICKMENICKTENICKANYLTTVPVTTILGNEPERSADCKTLAVSNLNSISFTGPNASSNSLPTLTTANTSQHSNHRILAQTDDVHQNGCERIQNLSTHLGKSNKKQNKRTSFLGATLPYSKKNKTLRLSSSPTFDYLHCKRKSLNVDATDQLFASYATTFKTFPIKVQACLKVEIAKLFAQAEIKNFDDYARKSQRDSNSFIANEVFADASDVLPDSNDDLLTVVKEEFEP